MKKTSITSLLIYIVTAELVGALSALITGSFGKLFETYTPPPLLPPAWLFPVVWVILYALMGISAYLVSRSEDEEDEIRKALTVYWVQLAFNFSWSIVFFRFEQFIAAAVIILILLILIIIMTVKFYKLRPLAGLLNIPYIIWVAFASYLNIATAIVNQ